MRRLALLGGLAATLVRRAGERLAPALGIASLGCGLWYAPAAWALIQNGRCSEALAYSRRALSLGTRDAVKLFHRGMAERCLGRTAAARSTFRRALAVNPYFSLRFAPVARRLSR